MMKSYKEMTKCVLEARDEHLKKKKRQNELIRQCVPVLSVICFIAISFCVWKNINSKPEIKKQTPIAEVTIKEKPTVVSSSEQEKTEASNIITTKSDNAVNTPSSSDHSETQIKETENKSVSAEISNVQIQTDFAETQGNEAVTESTSSLNNGLSEDGCVDNHVYLHWDEMNVNQKYFLAEFGEPLLSYSSAEKEVPVSETGDYMCTAFMTGYDWYELDYHYCETEVYKIKGNDECSKIAVKFSDDDKYYLYILQTDNNDKNMPDG